MNRETAIAMVVGDHGAIYTATDINGSWSNSSINVPQKLNSVMYADGKFVAIGDNGIVFTSTNGTSWTKKSNHSSKFAFDYIW